MVSRLRGRPKDSAKQIEAIRLYVKGLSYREIAKVLKFSSQRAQQLVRPPKAICDLVKRRAGAKCQKCGISIDRGHIHHAGPSGSVENFNDLENLVYLCASCHAKEHHLNGWYKTPKQKAAETTPWKIKISDRLRASLQGLANEASQKLSKYTIKVLEDAVNKSKQV